MKPAPFTELAVEFVGSFPDATHRLEPRLPEIALLGRSNVGKSSLLNALFGRPLAKTSNTPGRTALLNVFRLPTMYLLDLPGYGFARVSHGERERYQRLVKGLMEKRTTLTGVLWLLDIRHDPSPDDRAYAGTLADRGLPVLVAVTKGDKLPFAQRRRRLAELTRALALEDDQIQLTSSRTGEGIADLAASLLAAGSKEGA
ncbi:MAG: ribosome biogenesis GTP-binding protein YihA/YsxC [Gemmatimonadota bacterium]|nr:ribosome biogenesis GTP-binding protein YihA/YsxC [Gemmatimonadota bacterium]MDH5284464.1 ribosome biogenesis GTP-binding protein YihA/YsxC [Gemmatimonadota bacterium]